MLKKWDEKVFTGQAQGPVVGMFPVEVPVSAVICSKKI